MGALVNEQESFWTIEIGSQYRSENDWFSSDIGVLAWKEMTKKVSCNDIASYLECGSNIGRNIGLLKTLIPSASASVIEINSDSLEICKTRWDIASYYLGSISTAKFEDKFDLVFSCGVLIHVNPNDLLPTMSSMFDLSSRYVLIAEYFNRDSISISYRGSDEKLFKRDFGKLFVENFDVSLVDCGFLWSYVYEPGGFDDVTYWLFEKIKPN
jgi:pseudaminic acid biosynthesis-associated methylase